MAKKKKAVPLGPDGKPAPDTRSRERKSIDRARAFIDRMRLLSRNGLANLEDAVELAENPPHLSDEDETALFNLVSEARKLMRYLGTVVGMIDAIADPAEIDPAENKPKLARTE